MNNCFKNWLLAVLTVVGLPLALSLQAQTFKTLHSFSPYLGQTTNGWSTNKDGGNSLSTLTLSGSTLYGTAQYGGQWGSGTIFKLNVDGTGFQVLHEFANTATNSLGYNTNSDGFFPQSHLLLHSNKLYGTASGGPTASGTMFTLETNGDFQVIRNSGGNILISDGAMFFGVNGNGFGAVFAMSDDGNNLGTLFQFDKTGTYTGIGPNAGLTSSGTTLYGTTSTSWTYCCVPGGRGGGPGTVFALDTNGNLLWYDFVGDFPDSPEPGLVLLGTNLYGTTSGVWGGSPLAGAIFSIDTKGTTFNVIHTFAPASNYVNSDGINPKGLVLSGKTLYGVTTLGGTSGNGTVFSLLGDGSLFKVLHTFSGGADGAYPFAGLTLSGNILCGTTVGGGDYGNGTVFSITLPVPELAIAASSADAVLTWPADSGNFALQAATNLNSAVWATNLPPPVIVNGQYTVTNPISGAQQFFRLTQ